MLQYISETLADEVMFESIDVIFKMISNFSNSSKSLVMFATAVGTLVILILTVRVASQLIQVFRLYVLSQYCCQKDLVKKYGKWAVISGATDGIGQAMAKILAGRGMSIVVIGRNDEKLANTKAMLEKVPNVGEVVTVKIDLSDASVENFERIRQQIDPENRDIGLLINNAGMAPVRWARFNDYDINLLISIINVNIMAAVHLTRIIMPSMIERRKGLILNVSSLIGAVPGPYTSVYGATKAFMDSFTRQLQMEYDAHPLDIVLLTPGPVYTNMCKKHERSDQSRPSLLMPTSDDFALSALNGLSAGIRVYSGAMLHGFLRNINVFIFSLGFLNSVNRRILLGTRRHDM